PTLTKYIPQIQTNLNQFKQQPKIHYQFTPINTLIQPHFKHLFHLIQPIHQLPFHKRLHTLSTNITIHHPPH
ncbi:thiamine-binding protein, partial [Staphylococcus epidermidis]|uniref:thiamine-binding protein n=1 Tax=Staphylococcus epidermidis TaxID=1282 RepID=UPI0016436649